MVEGRGKRDEVATRIGRFVLLALPPPMARPGLRAAEKKKRKDYEIERLAADVSLFPSASCFASSDVPRAHQDASIGENPQEIYIVHQ